MKKDDIDKLVADAENKITYAITEAVKDLEAKTGLVVVDVYFRDADYGGDSYIKKARIELHEK